MAGIGCLVGCRYVWVFRGQGWFLFHFVLFWGLLFFGCVGLGFQEKVRPCCENVICCVRCRPVLLSSI